MTKKPTSKGRRAVASELPTTKESDKEAANRELYSADRPITHRNQDRFNRWPFAHRIATTISGFSDPASLVVGLYGPWGDGKTSTLRLMEEVLKDDPSVIVLRFNPWQFGSEDQLLRAFFDSLADSLGRSTSPRF